MVPGELGLTEFLIPSLYRLFLGGGGLLAYQQYVMREWYHFCQHSLSLTPEQDQ